MILEDWFGEATLQTCRNTKR